MAPIWIVSEDLELARGIAPALRALDEVVLGPPRRPPWRQVDPPSLVVWVGPETGGDPQTIERGLAFLLGVRRPQRRPVPVLYVDASGLFGDEIGRLVDDRPFRSIRWPPDPDRLTRLAGDLIQGVELPPSLRTRARGAWVRDRVERLYTGLDLPELRRAIDPRNARQPVLLLGEPGTRRGLLARYIHELAEPVRDRFVRLGLDQIEPGSLEERVLEATAGSYATLYVHGLDHASPVLQGELAELLTEGGGAAIETVRWIASAERASALALPLRLAPWIRVDLPAVRSRPDFDDLVVGIVQDSAEGADRLIEADDDTLSLLASYPWPGNLRELEAVIHTSVSRASGGALRPSDIALDLVPPDRPEATPVPETAEGEGSAPAADAVPEPIEEGDEPTVEAEPEESRPAEAFTGTGPEEGSILGPLVEEIRTPVRALRTLAGLLGQRPEDDSTRERLLEELDLDLGRIHSSLGRVERFVAFGRPNPKPVQVTLLLDAALRPHLTTVRDRSLVVLQEPDEGSPPALADEEQLGFALDALLDRVLRMVPAGGDLYLGSRHLAEEGDRPARHRILIRFLSPDEVLAPPSEARAGGVPLEVLLARTLIERMGGTLAVDVSGPHDNIVLIEIPA